MRTENMILLDGVNALKEKLGLVETEKFISIILREKFDYTEWQKELWQNKSLKDIHNEAAAYWTSNNRSSSAV